jgi:hypothetical protein
MTLLELSTYGVAEDIKRITINFDNVNSFHPSRPKMNEGNTTIHYRNGSLTFVHETYDEVVEALRKAHG